MATVCLVELHNVIFFSSYAPTEEELVAWRLQADGFSIDDALLLYDISAATYGSRMENIYSRGRAISVLKSILGRVTIHDVDGNTVDSWGKLFIPMLAHLIAALQRYYEAAFMQVEGGGDDDTDKGADQDDGSGADEEQGGAEHDDYIIPLKILFDRQLEWSTSRWPELEAAVKESTSENYDSECLAWDFPKVTITVNPPTSSRKMPSLNTSVLLQLMISQKLLSRTKI
jgi:hypothetical protein